MSRARTYVDRAYLLTLSDSVTNGDCVAPLCCSNEAEDLPFADKALNPSRGWTFVSKPRELWFMGPKDLSLENTVKPDEEPHVITILMA